jgi:hypothetical protein
MSKRVLQVNLGGAMLALAVMTLPALAQQGGAPSEAQMARRDSCYTAVTGDTAKLSAKIAAATASGSTMQEANRTVMAGLDSTKRRAVMTCARPARTTGSSGGNVDLGTNRARSQTRIPVSKEVGTGPVRDTVVAATPEPTPPAPTPEPAPTPAPVVAETTTYTPAPAPVVIKRIGNFYIGFGAGRAWPTEEIRQGFKDGVNLNVPIGWESETNPLGFRVNLGYTQFEGRHGFLSTGTAVPGAGSMTTALLPTRDVVIYSAMADLTLRVPFLGTWGGPMTGLYLVGGGGLNHFKNFSESLARTNPELTSGGVYSNEESLSRYGWNAGAGARFGLRMADIFVESRYVRTYMPSNSISHVPVTLGLALHY